MEERNLLDSLSLKALWAVQTRLHERVLERLENQSSDFFDSEMIEILRDISSMSKIIYDRVRKQSL